jgi:hypothetical protein
MKLPMHPALPNTIGDNDAHLTHPSSTYKSGNVVQINGATSMSCSTGASKRDGDKNGDDVEHPVAGVKKSALRVADPQRFVRGLPEI